MIAAVAMDTCSFSPPQLVKVFFDLLLFLISSISLSFFLGAQINRFVYFFFGQIPEAFKP